jgi:flagellar hook-length control protein FliK
LKAENQQVTAVLRDKAHELQGALRKLGLDVDNVTVTVSEEGDARTATGEQNLSDGKTFQDERNNMPNEGRQVVENTFGNKLADVSEAGLSRVTNAILDHWVA